LFKRGSECQAQILIVKKDAQNVMLRYSLLKRGSECYAQILIVKKEAQNVILKEYLSMTFWASFFDHFFQDHDDNQHTVRVCFQKTVMKRHKECEELFRSKSLTHHLKYWQTSLVTIKLIKMHTSLLNIHNRLFSLKKNIARKSL